MSKDFNIPSITIGGNYAPDISFNPPSSGGGNHFTDWTPPSSNFGFSGGGSFIPNGLVPDIHNVSTGGGSGFGFSGISVNNSGGSTKQTLAPKGIFKVKGLLGALGKIKIANPTIQIEKYEDSLDFRGVKGNHEKWDSMNKAASDVILYGRNLNGSDKSINAYSNLKVINLDSTGLGDYDFKSLIISLSKFNLYLDVLSLQNNDIGDPGVNNICYNESKVHSCNMVTHNIKMLNLSNNGNITDTGAKYISYAIKRNDFNNTDNIYLTGTNITHTGKTQLQQSLEGNTTLSIVLTGDTLIGEIPLSEEQVFSMYQSPEEIEFSNIKIIDTTHKTHKNIGKAVGDIISYGGWHSETNSVDFNAYINTKVMILDNTNTGDKDIRDFILHMGNRNLDLDYLSFANNQIGDTGFADFCLHSANIVWDKKNFSVYQIQHINFSNNHIGDEGIRQLSFYLKDHFPGLKTMNLSNNNIGDQGAKKIASALVTDNLSLEYLDVSGNNITPEGEGFFVEAMNNEIVKHIIVLARKVVSNSKMISGSKEEKIAIYRELLEQAAEKGANDQAIVVDTTWWGEIKNLKNQGKIVGNNVIGFIKCKWNPEAIVQSYAEGQLIAKLPKAVGKLVGNTLDINGIVSCYLEAKNEAWISKTGQEVLAHELCVMGEQEFCNDQ